MKTQTKLVSGVAALAGLSSGVVAVWANLGVMDVLESQGTTLQAGTPGNRVDLIGRATQVVTASIGATLPKLSAIPAASATVDVVATTSTTQLAGEVLGVAYAKSAGQVVNVPLVVTQPSAPEIVAASVDEPTTTTTTTTTVVVPKAPATTPPVISIPPAPPTVAPPSKHHHKPSVAPAVDHEHETEHAAPGTRPAEKPEVEND